MKDFQGFKKVTTAGRSRPGNRRWRMDKSATALLVGTPLFTLLMPFSGTEQVAFAATGNWKDLTYNGTFNDVNGIAVDSQGDVFVTSLNSSVGAAVEELPSGSTSWKDLTYGGSFNSTWGIALDSAGDVFVVNYNFEMGTNTPVVEELPKGSTTWKDLTNGGPFTGPGPTGVAVDGNGDVFVTSSVGTVEKLPSGKTQWEDIRYNGSFTNPYAIATDHLGNVFVTNGNTVEELPLGTTSWKDLTHGQSFGNLTGLVVDNAGDVLVADINNNQVMELPYGGNTWQFVTDGGSLNDPTSIAFDSLGHLFLVNAQYGAVPYEVEEYVAPPNSPTGLSSTSTTSTATTLAWNAVPFVSGYNVYENGKRIAAGVTGTNYTVNGLAADTPYTFTVTAVSANGESTPSSGYSVTTLANASGVPTGLTHSGVTATGWHETWDPVTGTGLGTVTYDVYLNGHQVGTTTSTFYDFTGEQPDTNYSVTIASVNGSGQTSNPSSPDQVTTARPFIPLGVGTNWAWNGQYGVPYNALQLQAVSGHGPYTWSVVQGSLPSGLTLSAAGTISGTPDGNDGTSTFTVQVKDADGAVAQRSLSIDTFGAPVLSVMTTSLPSASEGQNYATQLQPTGIGPLKWSLAGGSLPSGSSSNGSLPNGSLPSGLNLNPNGLISGTPTQSGQFTFTVLVTDGSGAQVERTYALYVAQPGPNQRVVTWNGDTQIVPALVRNNTTYMPLWYVMQWLKPMGLASTWNGRSWQVTTQSQPNLSNLHTGGGQAGSGGGAAGAGLASDAGSGLASEAANTGRGGAAGSGRAGIYLNGTLVQEIDTFTAADPTDSTATSTGGLTTYIPIWYVMQLLNRVGFHSSWDGTTWTVNK